LKKIVALEGDITLDNLGMSDEDLKRFNEKVNLIFHSAASIKMNEPIKMAIFNNTLSTKRLIAMSKNIKNLEVS
jgi:fatty acyl-CoA reductase